MTRVERNQDKAAIAARLNDWRQSLMSRRRFLLNALATSAGMVAFNAFASEDSPLLAPASTVAMDESWGEHVTSTLSAVQNILFPPDEGSPGADDIRALPYLLQALEDPALNDDRKFIRKGVGWLDDLSSTTYLKNFLQLKDDEREQLLRRIAQSRAGENWMSTLLLYIFEALLTDPVYGGNPGGIGWRWLEHAPGFPRPPADKTYRKLA